MGLKRSAAFLLLLTMVCSVGCGNKDVEQVGNSPDVGLDLLSSCITDVRETSENQMYEIQTNPSDLTGIEGLEGVYSVSGKDSDAYLIMVVRVNDKNREDVKHWAEVYIQNRKDVTELMDEKDYQVAQEAKVGEVEDYFLLVMHTDSEKMYSNLEDKLLVHIENLRHVEETEQV